MVRTSMQREFGLLHRNREISRLQYQTETKAEAKQDGDLLHAPLVLFPVGEPRGYLLQVTLHSATGNI